ncbi:hypothetical protein HPB49_000556 [Dermacentor silvarum]|uniref:Uncharacterized protein n=1 Tax=Dermacentor silvarum TaxID=543639 RepID=A0ACB8D1P8_DERSI|nr:hypothetical protein HPB49_000556 [Dermacentor silvarum]
MELNTVVLILCVAAASSQPMPTGISSANDEFAFTLVDLMNRAHVPMGFFCPYSLTAAMDMIYVGARNRTRRALYFFLGYKDAGIEQNAVVANVRDHALKLQVSSNYSISIANALVIDQGVNILPEYALIVKEFFGAEILRVNFKNDGSMAVNTINEWVDRRMQSRIKMMFDKPLPTSTTLLFIGAVAFKAGWKTQFDSSESKLMQFYNNGTQPVPVKAICGSVKARYDKNNGFYDSQLLDLPLNVGAYTMTISLPISRNGTSRTRRHLSTSFLWRFVNDAPEEIVKVCIPRLQLVSKHSLKELSWGALGTWLDNLFGRKDAPDNYHRFPDLSGITKDKMMYVDDIVATSVLEIDETGVTAGSTGAGLLRVDDATPPADFVADHPFVFIIWNKYGDILFIGEIDSLPAAS